MTHYYNTVEGSQADATEFKECFQAPISFGVWHSSSTSMSSAPRWQSWQSIFNYIQKKGFTCCSSARCWFTFIQLRTKNLAVKRHNHFLYAANEQLAIRFIRAHPGHSHISQFVLNLKLYRSQLNMRYNRQTMDHEMFVWFNLLWLILKWKQQTTFSRMLRKQEV